MTKGIFELENGGGLFGMYILSSNPEFGFDCFPALAREFNSRACKAIWDFEGIPFQVTLR